MSERRIRKIRGAPTIAHPRCPPEHYRFRLDRKTEDDNREHLNMFGIVECMVSIIFHYACKWVALSSYRKNVRRPSFKSFLVFLLCSETCEMQQHVSYMIFTTEKRDYNPPEIAI